MSRQQSVLFLCLSAFITFFGIVVAQTSSSSVGLELQDARIAFIDPDGQLATINADGSSLRILTEAPARYQFPTWSPDGSVVAAIGNEGSRGIIDLFEDSTNNTENSSEISSGTKTRVFESSQERPFYMYWSPDSKTISYLANNPEAGMAMSFVDVERKENRIRAFGNPFFWHWTADSSKLFIHQGLLNGQLGFIDAEGNVELEENISEMGLFRSPGISASGEYIAYASGGVRGTEIVIKNSPLAVAGSTAPEVSRSLAYDGFTAMSWSPAEDLLAFILPTQSSMSSFGNLAMMDAETGLLETLAEESVIAFFWSPDGKYILYLTPQRAAGNDFAELQYDIYRSTTSRDTARSQSYLAQSYLAQSDEIELAVNIVEASTGVTTYLASIRPTTNFINQFVPFFEQYALSHNVWSGDSQAVVLPTRDEKGMSNIAVIYIEDGSLDVIAEGSTPFWQH